MPTSAVREVLTHVCMPWSVWGCWKSVSVPRLLQSQGGTTGKIQSVGLEVPHSPSYPCAALPSACHCLPLQHARLYSHQRWGSLMPFNNTCTQGFLCIPPSSGDAGNLPLLHHVLSWTTAWRTSPSPPPRGLPPALLTPLHLTPVFFCLLFSLSVTYGCFCSALHRHRERAQLPLL